MVKRVLFLIIGFAMITAGVAGIATTIVDRRNEAALEQIEGSKEKARLAAAEEQRQMDEKKQEIDKLAMKIKEEKQSLEDERRMAERARRAAEVAVREQKKVDELSRSKPAPEKPKATAKAKEATQKSPLLSRKSLKPPEKSAPAGPVDRSLSAKAPKQGPEHAEEKTILKISRKAGMEAARLSEPIQYYNKRTDELILAEPFDFGYDSVRVRIRVWRNDRLVKDKVVSFSQASSGMLGSPRG